jgi:heme exporter protein C
MRRFLLALSLVMLIVSMWLALTLGRIRGPDTNPDSVVRNILYAHIPCSICALLCFVVLLVTSIGYLATGKTGWDFAAAASAEVGAVFATLLNITGMLFSRAEWAVWWTPSPRLITSAVLWFLYIVYLILRTGLPDSSHRRRRARVCAIFAIIAFLDVPMVIFSARLIPDIHRANFSFDSHWQIIALAMNIVSVILLAAVMIWLRTDILKNKALLENESSRD